MGQGNIIELRHVTKKYMTGQHVEQVLDDLTFDFKEGVKTSILGQSGCGKTTLLNLIGGIDSDFEGQFLFKGTPINDFDQYRREHVSFIFQDLNLISHHTLVKNIEVGLTNDVEEKEKIALDLLNRVGLSQHADKKPHQLSGGERQRVAIARALARDTDILLCDEPTGSLDKKTRTEIMDLIVEVFKDKTLIFITHDEELANKYSDLVLKIENKKVIIDHYNNAIENKSPLKHEKKSLAKNFKRRFEYNLLSKKLSIFNATYVLIIISAIFIFGMGVVLGVEEEIDNVLYDSYKVDSIPIGVYRMTIDGFSKNILDYNDMFEEDIRGFMTGVYSTITFSDEEVENEKYLMMIQPEIKDNIVSDIVYGRFPEELNEILYSKGSAIKTLFDYYSINTKEEEIPNLYNRITGLSDEALFNELNSINISYKNYCIYNPEKFYDKDLEIVGLVDDGQYYPYIEEPEPFMTNIKRYNVNYTTHLVQNEEMTLVTNTIYMLEDEFLDYAKEVYIGQNSLKLSSFYVFIDKEDLDLRNTIFDNYLLFKPLFNGRDDIIEERESYYKEVHGYKVAIIGGCIIIAIFAIVSLYNGLKTNIVRHRKNIGIYKSLGYTTRNIKHMFFVEGLIIAGFVLVSTLIVWAGINLMLNEHLVDALDPNRILEMTRIINLDIYTLIGIVLAVIAVIISSIARELRKTNIINLLRP